MRLLVDECCSPLFAALLGEAGHDVLDVRRYAPGLKDAGVADLARAQTRVLVTHDYGFGDKAVRLGMLPDGVILVASPPGVTVEERLERLLRALVARGDALIGAFTIVDGRGARSRRL